MPEPRGDLLFFQNNLPTDFVSHGGRLVSNKSLLSLIRACTDRILGKRVARTRIQVTRKDDSIMESMERILFLSTFSLSFFSNFPTILSGEKNFFSQYNRDGSG